MLGEVLWNVQYLFYLLLTLAERLISVEVQSSAENNHSEAGKVYEIQNIT